MTGYHELTIQWTGDLFVYCLCIYEFFPIDCVIIYFFIVCFVDMMCWLTGRVHGSAWTMWLLLCAKVNYKKYSHIRYFFYFFICALSGVSPCFNWAHRWYFTTCMLSKKCEIMLLQLKHCLGFFFLKEMCELWQVSCVYGSCVMNDGVLPSREYCVSLCGGLIWWWLTRAGRLWRRSP